MRTLLVEDDSLQRAALEEGLRRLGLDVTAVPDANAGLVAHLRQPFELLVIDMVLPGMDGLKLCQKVRSIRGGDHPYILMITGRGSARDLTKVLDAGADDFLVKPIDDTLLLTRIRIAERRRERPLLDDRHASLLHLRRLEARLPVIVRVGDPKGHGHRLEVRLADEIVDAEAGHPRRRGDIADRYALTSGDLDRAGQPVRHRLLIRRRSGGCAGDQERRQPGRAKRTRRPSPATTRRGDPS